jgi:hypothetical protein
MIVVITEPVARVHHVAKIKCLSGTGPQSQADKQQNRIFIHRTIPSISQYNLFITYLIEIRKPSFHEGMMQSGDHCSITINKIHSS